mgnify:CR=1 FL=1
MHLLRHFFPVWTSSTILLVLFLIRLQPTYAQQSEAEKEQLAIQFFQDGKYQQAANLFADLFETRPSSSYMYEYYFQSLLQGEEFRTAEKMLKEQIRSQSDPGPYQVDLGYLYKLADDPRKSERAYEKALGNMPANESRILQVANTFYRRGELDYAVKAYQRGRKLMEDPSAFRFQLANVYAEAGEKKAMIGEYLDALQEPTGQLSYVKNRLQRHFGAEEYEASLRQQLLRRIQNQPDNPRYAELMSWYYIQKEDYEAAFRQLKAMDRRTQGGKKEKMLHLANVAARNGAFETAALVYEYIIEEEERGALYLRARMQLMDVRYQKIKTRDSIPREELELLEGNISDFLGTYYNRLEKKGDLVEKLAEIKAVYLGHVPEAIRLLENQLQKGDFGKAAQARLKLALGDYYLLEGDPWEATLYYGQVEKMFRDHPLGHEAKFRGAKLAFYRGDFDFAQAKLNVLKGSTSELIANNALELSLLIQDNLGLDTTTAALELYADADLLIYKKRYDQALDSLAALQQRFPGHMLTDEVLFAQARIYEARRQYRKAIERYQEVVDYQKNDLLADNALYRIGRLYEDKLKRPDQAFKAFETLIFDHPGSVFVVDARERFRRLRGDRVN